MATQQNLHSELLPPILRVLIYYDVFNYPLTFQEIKHSCNMLITDETNCKKALEYLIEKGIVFKFGDYYTLNPEKEIVHRRIKGNQQAEKWMKKARWFSRIISGFPYVRAVSLTGSLSKGFVDEDPDIDYFIITRPNRLWFTRSLLVLFKKIFLLNSYRYFCVNYFIDSENLEIEEKNLFTATEINTLIPVYGHDVKKKFYEKNIWVKKYYPNFSTGISDIYINGQNRRIKKAFEFLLNNRFGDWLDDVTMNITVNHWLKKFNAKYTKEEFDLLFKSNKSVSKHHPRNFQQYVLDRYKDKAVEISDKCGINSESLHCYTDEI